MTHYSAPRRYRAPQLVDRGRIIEHTLMSVTEVIPEDNPECFTRGTSI